MSFRQIADKASQLRNLFVTQFGLVSRHFVFASSDNGFDIGVRFFLDVGGLESRDLEFFSHHGLPCTIRTMAHRAFGFEEIGALIGEGSDRQYKRDQSYSKQRKILTRS